MSRIYTNTNKIKFTHISDKYKVNKSVKGKISELHACIITYVVSHFSNTKKYKQKIVDALNIITYAVYADEPLPFTWSLNAPFDNLPDIDQELIEETLGDVLLTVEGIDWDVKVTSNMDSLLSVEDTASKPEVAETVSAISRTTRHSASLSNSSSSARDVSVAKSTTLPITNPTPKQDLYIQSPAVPQFDYNKPWIKGTDGVDNLVIYSTRPEIPTKQNEISVTTDVTKMSYQELMNLYPNCLIHTRASVMYEKIDGVELHPVVGLILPIEGFTRDQILDNIIRYPHIFKLSREINGRHSSFYSHIEIDGQLYGTLDIWDTLPESKILPRQAEFVKEYVVRRYLLERDVKGIQHKYPIYGTFDPFLTLFMPADDYMYHGYTNVEEIVKQCVLSRVSYKQSRNPVLRRLNDAQLHI